MKSQNLSHEKTERIKKILTEFEPEKANLIPILHRIQDSNDSNYVPEDVIREICDYLNVTPSEIYGVISFYTMFSVNPRGKYIVRVCDSAPCHVMGSTTVIDSLEKILGITMGETTEDNLFTLEFSSCLGVCDVAPAMMINDEIYGNLTHEKIKEIVRRLQHE